MKILTELEKYLSDRDPSSAWMIDQPIGGKLTLRRRTDRAPKEAVLYDASLRGCFAPFGERDGVEQIALNQRLFEDYPKHVASIAHQIAGLAIGKPFDRRKKRFPVYRSMCQDAMSSRRWRERRTATMGSPRFDSTL